MNAESTDSTAESSNKVEKFLKQSKFPGELITAVLCNGDEYGKRKGYLGRITTEGIEIYN